MEKGAMLYKAEVNLDMGIPRNILPVKAWGCRSIDVYQKANIVGKGTFG